MQKFGKRDNETFNISIVIDDNLTYEIAMQYNYDDDGDQIEPFDWCRKSFKHVSNNSIDCRDEDELDLIIEKLKSIKTRH